MKLYIGTKFIKAESMTHQDFCKKMEKGPRDSEPRQQQDGYFVEYPDGYKSWSPKDVFESAYRLITPAEFNLIGSPNFNEEE